MDGMVGARDRRDGGGRSAQKFVQLQWNRQKRLLAVRSAITGAFIILLIRG
jgi:hypothetical protein